MKRQLWWLLSLTLILPLLVACGATGSAPEPALPSPTGATSNPTQVLEGTATLMATMETTVGTGTPAMGATGTPAMEAATPAVAATAAISPTAMTDPPEPATTPEAVPTAAPVATAAAPAGGQLPTDVLMFYGRDGGFAGFCDTLTVRRDGSAEWTSCNRDEGALHTLQLDPIIHQQLLLLTQQYAPFSQSVEDAPGAADSMTQTIQFNGTGSTELPAEVLVTLNAIASQVLSEVLNAQ